MTLMDKQRENATLIQGHMHVARMSYRAGDYHAAYRNLNSAMHWLHEAQGHPLDDQDMHELRRLFGKVHVATRGYEQAELAFRLAIDLGNSSQSIDEDAVLSDKRHLADCIRLQNRFAEAESIYLHCIEKLKDSDSKTKNQLPKSYLGLSQVYIDNHRFTEAEKAVTTALSMFESTPGAKSFWFGRTLVTLARLRWAQGRTGDSKEILQQALNILEPLIGPHHPIRVLALRRLANVLNSEGNERTAKALFDDIKEVEKYLKNHDT